MDFDWKTMLKALDDTYHLKMANMLKSFLI